MPVRLIRLVAPVCKTGVPVVLVGSNPSAGTFIAESVNGKPRVFEALTLSSNLSSAVSLLGGEYNLASER